MKTPAFASKHLLYIAATACVLTPTQVFAQSSAMVLEEVIVTARKRSETLQDVPFSINAQTEEMMRNAGATDLDTLANNVAGLSVQNLGPGQSQVVIRGISAGQIVRDQPGVKEQVGVYVDESVISLSLFTPDLDFFDMNRVEVLRGPQGTLFGSGSLSGTIRHISNQPDLEAFSGTLEAGVNSIDEGGVGGDLKGMLNIPMGDVVALRAVAYRTEYAGFVDALQPDGSVNDDVNDGDRTGLRVALKIQPIDSLTITPRIIYQEINVNGFNRSDEFNIFANPFTTTRPAITLGDLQQFTQLEEKFEDEFTMADLTVEYDLGPVVLTSVSSYTDRSVLVRRDATQLTGSITGQIGAITPTGLSAAVYTLDAPLSDTTDVEVFTQELRIASNGDGALDWVAGVFYSDIERNYAQSLDVPGFEAALLAEDPANAFPTAGVAAGTDVLYFSAVPYDFEQFALFGEVSYAFTDRLTATLGLRYFDFEEERELTFDGIFAQQTLGVPGKTESDGVSPRVIVSYDFTDDIQLNAQVAKGFRLGGINDPLNEPLCNDQDFATFNGNPAFDDEEVLNYEVGAKIQFAEGRAIFNVAAFRSEIENLQATLDAGSCSSRVIINVPDAESMGVEFELTTRPTDNFQFSLAGSWIKAELTSTVRQAADENTPLVPGPVLAGIEDGNRLPTAPEVQFAASTTYSLPLGDSWEGFATGTFQYVGSRYTQIGDQAEGFETVNLITEIGGANQATFEFDAKLPDYSVVNLRVGARSESWDVALFVNNAGDERALLALDRERGGSARVGFLTNQPRTIGLTTRYLF